MSRTNIEIDDELIERAIRLYRLKTKREAVDFALRALVGDGNRKAALELEGMGWEGDLDEMRRSRADAIWSGTWER